MSISVRFCKALEFKLVGCVVVGSQGFLNDWIPFGDTLEKDASEKFDSEMDLCCLCCHHFS